MITLINDVSDVDISHFHVENLFLNWDENNKLNGMEVYFLVVEHMMLWLMFLNIL